MSLVLIHNPDMGRGVVYKIARVVYAETGGASLPVVEALTSMISNMHKKSERDWDDIISDETIFNVLDKSHPRNQLLAVPVDNRGFQMCLRVAMRMMRGGLDDTTHGAVMFHHDDEMPGWAMARGYIADIDGLLFYR